MKGQLYIVSAPSGAGKTTLLHALVKQVKVIEISVSYTTRVPRPKEQDGRDYHFIAEDQFMKMREAGEFLESATVFDHYYGTSKQVVAEKLEAGIDLILVIDWQGAEIIRKQMSDVITVFILPPSKVELRHRLSKRASDSAEIIESRMSKARGEMLHYSEYDYVVINDNFDKAVFLLKSIVQAARLGYVRQKSNLKVLLEDLLKDS